MPPLQPELRAAAAPAYGCALDRRSPSHATSHSHRHHARSIMRYTYAYLGAEAYSPVIHELRHSFIVGDRVRCRTLSQAPAHTLAHVVARTRTCSCRGCATCSTRWYRRAMR